MKNIDALRQFEIEIGTMNDLANKPSTYESQMWLNQGYLRFIKTRYSGMNFKRKGFEQDQKRVEDLKKLVKSVELTLGRAADPTEYLVQYPADHYISLGEDVYIDTWKDPVDVFECTIENYTTRLNNSLTDVHSFHGYARPARLLTSDGAKLKTTDEYIINKYVLYYLSKPKTIDILTKPQDEFTDLNEIAQPEVIKLAANMYIENKSNPRYKTYQNEITQME